MSSDCAAPGNPYRPLQDNQIRVLKLLPRKHGEELRATLEHVLLPIHEHEHSIWDEVIANVQSNDGRGHTDPAFEAISYAWGSTLKPYSIRIGDRGIVKITESLHDALRAFRFDEEARYLWTDAVCIDQENTDERSQQVAIMVQIYAASSCVLVWLGLSQDPQLDASMSDVAMIAGQILWEGEETPTVAGIARKLRKTCLCRTKPDAHVLRQCIGKLDGKSREYVLRALEATRRWLNSPWFSRLWVLQEMLSARKLLFCSNTFQVDGRERLGALFFTLDHRWRLGKRPHANMSEVSNLTSMLDDFLGWRWTASSGAPKPDSVLYALIDFALKGCADPRDRLFAIRSIIGLDHVDNFRPDYRMTPGDLFNNLTLWLLAGKSHLWGVTISPVVVLSLACWVPQDGSENSTSWSLNLHNFSHWTRAKARAHSRRPKNGTEFDRDHRCHDGRTWDQWAYDFNYTVSKFDCSHLRHQPRRLFIRGRLFAENTRLLTLPSVPLSCEGDTDFIPTLYSCFEEFQDWYAAWYQFFMAFFDSSVHGFDVHKELLNFLSYPSHWTSELYSMYRVDNKCPKEFWDRYAQSRPRCCNLPGKSAKFRKAQYFLMLSLSECPLIRNRRAWEINSNGRVDLAWLPKEAQTGDQICLFAGAVWPFVVRPVGDDNYRLIGDCHTYSTPLIEALGGTYDVDKHGDGHVHNYFRGPGGEGWESEEPGSSEELGSEQSGSEQSGSEESGSDEADSEETSSGKTDSEEAKYEELEGEESESEELGGASETESGEPGRKGPESDVDEESIIEGSESDVDRDMTDGTLSPQVRFVRGERLSFNMRGLLDDEPSLRYDEYIEQMDYLALV